jgi:hypothetical protein
MISAFLIPIDRFDNLDYIESRLAVLDSGVVGAMRTTLRYLYLTAGPVNLPRERFKRAKPFLEPAERVVAGWLYTRTNGSGRKSYGTAALRAARKQRYRCEHCGHADVRVLNLDHVEGRDNRELFACLCSNCHCLKSRERDWSGAARGGNGD